MTKTKTLFSIFILFLLVICVADTGSAAPPIPQPKAEKQGFMSEQIARTQNEKAALQESLETLEGDLKSMRRQSVDLAETIQINEAKLQSLENEIGELQTKSSALQADLEQDQVALARLVMGLQKMRRMPPEALFLRPGDPQDLARSAMLLSHIVPDLQDQALQLQRDLKNLKSMQDALVLRREEALQTTQALKQEEDKLNVVLQARQEIYSETTQNLAEKERDAERLAREARNVRQLVQKLQPKPEQKSAASGKNKTRPQRSAVNVAAGASRMPVAGSILVNYNEPDHLGAKSQGIRIEARSRALVVAPMGGVVRFAGPFQKFGNVVILEHKGGYHSLVAGLGQIDISVEQVVQSGEPLGRMTRQDHVLYYELRHRGKPINPARKLKIARAL